MPGSAGIPQGPGVPAWDPPATFNERLLLAERGSGIGTQAQLTAFIAGLPAGAEYMWNLTDGAGTLLDIVTGVA